MRLPDLNDLIQDLQLAKEISIKNEQPNSLVISVMAQAKLLGIDKVSNNMQPLPSIHVSYDKPEIVNEVAERCMELNNQY